MNAVWVVRNATGSVIGTSVTPTGAVRDVLSHCGSTTRRKMGGLTDAVGNDRNAGRYESDGFTITLETLLTPAHAAVIEAAKRQADAGRRWETCTCGGRCAHEINYEMACSDTDFAVSTLRALEGDA